MSDDARPALRLLAPRGARITAGLGALAVSGWFLWQSLLLQGVAGTDAVGPGAFPGLVAGIMLLASLALLTGLGERAPDQDDPAGEGVTMARPGGVLALFVGVLALALAFDRVPAYAAIALFTFGAQFALGERRWALLAGGSAALSLLIWLLFAQLLRVPL